MPRASIGPDVPVFGLAPSRQTGTARPTITGIVACYNEAANIEACLASLAWCDELIVVDSYSTDCTPEIAQRNPKVRFYQHEYYGDGAQRNWAINLARTDWFLVLDADERCSEALRAEIEQLLAAHPAAAAFTIPRTTYFLDRRLRFSGWQNDRAVRLVRRGSGFYSRLRVHAGIVTIGGAPMLQNPIHHHMVQDFHTYVKKINQYGYWGAAQCWRDGRGAGLGEVLIRPGFRFLRTYFLQLGVLDGTRGLVFCLIQSYQSYLKWSLLWSWRVGAKLGRLPALPEFDADPAVWSGLGRIEAGRAGPPSVPAAAEHLPRAATSDLE